MGSRMWSWGNTTDTEGGVLGLFIAVPLLFFMTMWFWSSFARGDVPWDKGSIISPFFIIGFYLLLWWILVGSLIRIFKEWN